MNNEILLYDPKTAGHREFLEYIKIVSKNENMTLIPVNTLQCLRESTLRRSWPIIFVNFKTDEFLKNSPAFIYKIIREIKQSQKNDFILAGFTSDNRQKKTLSTENIQILHDIYDRFRIPGVFGITQSRTSAITIENISHTVCNFFDIPYEKIFEKTNKADIATVRQIIRYLARMVTPYSLKSIAEYFGSTDHSNVLYSCNIVKDLMDNEADFRKEVLAIIDTIVAM